MFEPTRHVLQAVSMGGRTFREHVEAAAAGGFDGITVLYPAYRRAIEEEGLSREDMRALLDDAGVVVDQVEVLHEWSFPDHPADQPNPCGCGLCPDRAGMIEMAETLRAEIVIASQRTEPLPAETLGARLAALCDDFRPLGLRVAIEFIPYSSLNRVEQVAAVLAAADRPNAGLCFDVHHHLSTGGSDEALAAVAPERIFTVQVADGSRFPADMTRAQLYDTMISRGENFLPGDGELPWAPTMATLSRMGVRASFGVEVRRTAWTAAAATDVARELHAAGDRVLASV